MPIDTTRSMQLQQLAQSLPGANQQIQQGLQGARTAQLQQTIGQMGASQATSQNVQALGAQQAAQAGQINQAGQQRLQNQLTSTGQLGLAEQSRQVQAEGAQQQIALSEQSRYLANKLSQVDNQLKTDLVDKQMQFQKDKAGNALFNTRQLADYAAVNARNQEEFANYSEQMDKIYQRKAQIYQAAHASIMQALQQGFIANQKPLDEATKKQLVEAAAAFQQQQIAAENKANNVRAQTNAISTVLGMGVGAGVMMASGGTAAGALAAAGVGGSVAPALANIAGFNK